ncbi:hypothetical protein SSAG_04920 [Streptomyces sp. Mg1]|nr:hypothetical protein SSAG_04920 [Streptomyces sp. Mg1]
MAYAALGDEVPCDEPVTGCRSSGDKSDAALRRDTITRPGVRRSCRFRICRVERPTGLPV